MNKTNSLHNDILKIMKRPNRAGFSIAGSLSRRIIESLSSMDSADIRSLHEYLTVIPTLSESRVHLTEDLGRLKANNIVCSEPKRRILINHYGPDICIRCNLK